MSKKQKKNLSRIILSAVILIILQFTNFDRIVNLFLYLISYLLVGYDVLLEAFNGIKNKQAFDESLLILQLRHICFIQVTKVMIMKVLEESFYH